MFKTSVPVIAALIAFSQPSDANATNLVERVKAESHQSYRLSTTSNELDAYVDDKNIEFQQQLAQYKQQIKHRYIIEFHEQPLIVKKAELAQRFVSKSTTTNIREQVNTSTNKAQLDSAILSYSQSLKSKQHSFASSALKNKLIHKFIRQNTQLHNSIVIETHEEQLPKLRSLPSVKAVHKVNVVSKTLAESVDLIKAPQAWQMTDGSGNTLTGKGIKVAIIDTGIDYNHPDIGGCMGENCKVIQGYDFINDDNDPMDGDGHGTHVAGIVAASGTDIKGVAPDATLMAIKVLSDDGIGYDDSIIAGIEYAVDPDGDPTTDDGAHVINMSLGGWGDANSPISVASNNAVAAGVIVVVAAGNDGNYGDIGKHSPSAATDVITVGSTTKNDEISDFSSKGPSATSERLKPEIVAPGSDINSLGLSNGYAVLSGTSMASPHVAGAAALLKQANLNLSPEMAKAKLVSGAINIDADPHAQGHGRLDIVASLDSELLLVDSTLMLGRVNEDDDSLSFTRTITLFNSSDSEVLLTASLPDSFPDDVSISLDSDTVMIPANSEMSVDVYVDITNIKSIPYPENSAGIFFGDITFTSELNPLRVPVVLERNYRFTVTHNNPNGISLTIDDQDGNTLFWNDLAPGEEKQFFIVSSTLYVQVEHKLTSDNLPHISFPDINSNNKLVIAGYEEHVIEVSDTGELAIDMANLSNLVGPEQVLNEFEENVINEHVSVNRAIITQINFGDYRTTYGSHSTWDSNHPKGKVSSFIVTGNLVDEINTVFTQVEKLVANETRQHDTYFHFYSALNTDTEKLYTLNEKESDFLSFSAAEYLTSTPSQTSNYDFHFAIPDNELRWLRGVSANTPTIRYAIQQDSSPALTTNISLIDGDTLVAGSPLFTFDSDVYENSNNDIVKLVSDGSMMELNAESMVFSGNLSVFDNNLYHASQNTLSGLTGNHLERNLAAEYQLSCAGNIIGSGNYDWQDITVDDLLDCENIEMIVNFDSYLEGVKHRSNIVHQSTSTMPYFNGLNAMLWVNDKPSTNRSVIGGNTKLIINTSSNNWVDVNEVSIKVNDDSPWQELTIESSSLVEGGYEVTLPKVTSEKSSVSVLVRYTGINSESVQELNGLFYLGIDTSETGDVDNDGILNRDDSDDDNDGVPDEEDAFPFDVDESVDTDLDGIGNNADSDDDNDNVPDIDDAFPLDESESLDTDLDGIGNNTDTDDDGDGVDDINDAFPLDATESVDTDNDGIGNNIDTDDDNDNVDDVSDVFPLDASESTDTDLDGIGNNADTDDDGDGVLDTNDFYPLDPSRSEKPVTNNSSSGSSGGGSMPVIFLLQLIALRVFWKTKLKKLL